MHGTEHSRSRAPDASPLCSPDDRFLRPQDQCFQARRSCLSLTGPVARNGLSLARNGCPSRGLHSGVNVPDLLLRSLARPASRPFGLSAPLPRSGSPRSRPLHRFWPVAASTAGSAGCSHRLHSPSGLLPPSGSKRSTAFAACRPAFRIRPISFRSPLPFLFLVLGCGSPFQVRYVSGGLLFLKPLGTFFTMLPKPDFGQSLFVLLQHLFLNIYFACFQYGYRRCAGASRVDKTTRPRSCFCDTVSRNAQTRHPARRHRRFHRFPARARVPARRLPGSLDRLAATSRWCDSPTACAPSPPPASTCSASPSRRRGSDRGTARASIPSSPGTAPTGPSSATLVARARPAVHVLPALPPEGAGIHATDFYLDQVRTIADCAERRHPAHPRAQATARELRRDPPVLRQPAEELAAREVPRARRAPGAHHAGPLVRRPRRSAAAEAPSASTICTNWPAGWPGARSTSATIPASRTWPRPSERPCWRCSGPPTRRSGRRAATTFEW